MLETMSGTCAWRPAPAYEMDSFWIWKNNLEILDLLKWGIPEHETRVGGTSDGLIGYPESVEKWV